MGSRCGFPDNEFRFEDDLFRIGFIRRLNTTDEQLSGGRAHFVQRLANGGEARIVVLGYDNVVESDDGDVLWTTKANIFDGAYGSNGGCIVEAEDGGEIASTSEKLANRRVAEVWRPRIFFQVNAQLGTYGYADFRCDVINGIPSDGGVWNKTRSFHKGNSSVAKIVKVPESHFGGTIVIEYKVADAGNLTVG